MSPDPELLKALAQAIATARSRCAGVPIVGIAGAQGSGKTTLVGDYCAEHPDAIAFSLDDVYLPSGDRQKLAQGVHPLFVTRGPPGAHDLALLDATLRALEFAQPASRTQIPAFDKMADEPVPPSGRRVFCGRPSAILLDGWCLGATPQPAAQLDQPVNRLEAEEDADGVWRRAVNAGLAGAYAGLFSSLGAILYLKPPSFDVVLDWRCQQEEGLLGRPLTGADRARIAGFIAHFERITRHMMAGGVRADVTAQLDSQRRVVGVTFDV